MVHWLANKTAAKLSQVKFDIIIQRKVIQTVELREELEKVNASHIQM